MGACGYGENVGPVGGVGCGGLGTSTAAILVLFILLVIITKAFWV
ncbi:YjcZ family sporulation protein [Paenibacillus sp. PK3_47]|nr:YjcZ family sporulation protein [Paenibacillus sp. PK3_47]